MEPLGSDAHFHTQLSSIMEMLVKTAVCEIGRLVEQSHSVLRLEISRHICENETLKNKCELLENELRATRRRAQQPAPQNQTQPGPQHQPRPQHKPGHHSQLGAASKGGSCCQYSRESQNIWERYVAPRPTIDGVFGKEWCMDLWREKESVESEKVDTHTESCVSETVDLMDDEPDMIIIKDETYEDCSGKNKLQQHSKSGEKGHSNAANAQRDLAESHEDFITYTIPLDGTLQRHDPSFDPTSSTASSSNVNSNDFSGFYPGNVDLNALKGRASGSEPKKFECIFCGKNFNYFRYLKLHLRTHSGEKPFACTLCDKRFAQKTYLKIHLRTHSGERPYTCVECGKSFSQKCSLNIHLRSHTGEKPYSCVDCGKRYAYKHGLNSHQCTS